MVIGVSDSNINLITEIQDKDEIDRIRLLSSKSTPVTTRWISGIYFQIHFKII